MKKTWEPSRWSKRSTHLWIQAHPLTSNATTSLFSLKGKVAVITGGNGGIGLGRARGLARADATIVIWARDITKNAAAKSELEAFGDTVITLEVDVTDRAAVESATARTIELCGGINILFANAGVNIRMRPEEYTEDIVDQKIDVNLKAVFHCCQSVYPSMTARGGGKIILIGSLTSVQGLVSDTCLFSDKGCGRVVSKEFGRCVGCAKYSSQHNITGLVCY